MIQSPHAGGGTPSSFRMDAAASVPEARPAHARVNRRIWTGWGRCLWAPRPCGGEPPCRYARLRAVWGSPHTRGWTADPAPGNRLPRPDGESAVSG